MRRAGWLVEVVRSLADVRALLAAVESGSYAAPSDEKIDSPAVEKLTLKATST